MHVLFLTHRLPYAPNRGDRIRAYHLIRHVAEFAQVSLFSLVHDAHEASHVTSVDFVSRLTTVRVPRLHNLAQGAIRLGTRQPLTHALLNAPDATEAIRRCVGTDPPDLVVAYCSGMARFAMAAPLNRIPFVLDMVDVDSAKWAELATRSGAARRWIYRREAKTLARFEAAATRAARATLVVNSRERDEMHRLAPDAHVHVVPNGIDLAGFRPPADASPSAEVVFCGMMNYAPNIAGVRWFAQEVWPRVRAARPDARLTIVGAHPPDIIKGLAERDSTIEVTGAVPAVQPYLWRSAVSVAPLQVARGLQNKVLEGLAAGLPVVVTAAVMSGLPQGVQPGCLEADTPETFAASVLTLLELTPTERRGRAGAANLQALEWAQQLGSLEQILRGAAT